MTKTPLQTAFFIMLAVIIPFLLLMIGLYVYSSMVKSRFGTCDEFCQSFIFLEGQSVVPNDPKPPPGKPPSPSPVPPAPPPAPPPSDNKTSRIEKPGEDKPKESGRLYLPNTTELSPHISSKPSKGKRKQDKSKILKGKHQTCESELQRKIPYSYIVSILEPLYGSLDNLRYLCSGAIISKKWVVSTTECISDDLLNINLLDVLYVRAGSEYWSLGGVLHEIKQIKYPSEDPQVPSYPTILAFELTFSLLDVPAISSVKIPQGLKYRERIQAIVFSWSANDNVTFENRKKHQKLHPNVMELYTSNGCNYQDTKEYIFCGDELVIGDCSLHRGAPLVRTDILIGLHVSASCNLIKNVHYFLDVRYYYKWLKSITNLYFT